MTVRVVRGEDGWNLEVDGETVIRGESFAVVDQVADRLRRPEWWAPGEVQELADGIRERRGGGR